MEHNHARASDQRACERGDCPTYAYWRKQERLQEIRRRRRLRQALRDSALAELHAIAEGP